MTDSDIIERIKGELRGLSVEIANPARRRIFLKVPAGDLVTATARLREALGMTHVSTISGLDKGGTFEIIYHFSIPEADINIRTEIPKDNPHVESLSPVIPGAILYERELQDMFGMVVDHIPDPRPLVVPDDWPAGNYPLRKDWKFDRPAEVIPGEKP